MIRVPVTKEYVENLLNCKFSHVYKKVLHVFTNIQQEASIKLIADGFKDFGYKDGSLMVNLNSRFTNKE